MSQLKLLQTLEIPEFITKVQISKKRRKKYYRKKNGKWKPRALPKTFKEKLDNGTYKLDSKGYLLNKKGNRKVANPQAAGTPKYAALSGNNFYSGYNSHFIRAKLTKELKKFYEPFVDKQLDPFRKTEYPLAIQWDLHTTLGKGDWDADNLGFYWKYLQDTLVATGKIPDDNIKFITIPPSPRFVPVEDWKDRKFVVRFYSDIRENVLEYFKQNNIHG